MPNAIRIALILTLHSQLVDEQAMIKKFHARYIELDIESFTAELEAMEEE